ncbi:GNAT family N-acetyltransferase [Haloarcula amylovorans]|uniref:GNAT family N-acetyltransferase n=1 Tax=Haloarcula amylovorans TaxID=2562280 RepID=UPI00107628AE|nr:GNAT family protein [Halomicroarcula amylolytica]
MPGPAFLRSEAVTLRPVNADCDDDVQAIQRAINNPNTRRPMGLTDPHSAQSERAWLQDLDDREDHILLFIATDENTPVGNVELFDIDHCHGRAELGCWVYEPHRGQGYATAACQLMLRYAFTELRLHRVDAVVYDTNDASQALIETLGFAHEGVKREFGYLDGEFVDQHQYGILGSEFSG